MIYKVKVNGKVYEVEIFDLDDRPIKAIIDEEVFEAWPVEDEEKNCPEIINRPANQANISILTHSSKDSGLKNNQNRSQQAPLPGVILSISVKEGDVIKKGQELCVIEAMKMKNVIKAMYDGKISKVMIVPGQHVKHRDILISFE